MAEALIQDVSRQRMEGAVEKVRSRLLRAASASAENSAYREVHVGLKIMESTFRGQFAPG